MTTATDDQYSDFIPADQSPDQPTFSIRLSRIAFQKSASITAKPDRMFEVPDDNVFLVADGSESISDFANQIFDFLAGKGFHLTLSKRLACDCPNEQPNVPMGLLNQLSFSSWMSFHKNRKSECWNGLFFRHLEGRRRQYYRFDDFRNRHCDPDMKWIIQIHGISVRSTIPPVLKNGDPNPPLAEDSARTNQYMVPDATITVLQTERTRERSNQNMYQTLDRFSAQPNTTRAPNQFPQQISSLLRTIRSSFSDIVCDIQEIASESHQNFDAILYQYQVYNASLDHHLVGIRSAFSDIVTLKDSVQSNEFNPPHHSPPEHFPVTPLTSPLPSPQIEFEN